MLKEVPALMRPKVVQPMGSQELRRYLAIEAIRVQIDAVRKRWGEEAVQEALKR